MTTEAPRPDGLRPGWKWLAFAWGLAEALFFFIVPDVLTSRLVLRDTRRGFMACLYGVAGALIGGAVLFELGRACVPLLAAMDYIPGIGDGAIELARAGLEQSGLAALFTGALGGLPYKLFAAQAAAATDSGIGLFLLVSALARLARFGVVTGVAWAAGVLMPRVPLSTKLWIHAVAWTVFYAFYFWRTGL
jgi:hypothetical protein